VGVLLIGAAASSAQGVIALLLFAGATALSMALVSSVFGYVLARDAVARRLIRMVPILGSATLVFGVWYALAAVGLS
jgi:hypothetical protein